MDPLESRVHLRHYSPGLRTQRARHFISPKVNLIVAPVSPASLMMPLTPGATPPPHLRSLVFPLLSLPCPLWVPGCHLMMNGAQLAPPATALDSPLPSPSRKNEAVKLGNIIKLGTNRQTNIATKDVHNHTFPKWTRQEVVHNKHAV